MAPPKVFISYRRSDSAGHAGRVKDRLEHEFGSDLLFLDVETIPLGSDFIKVIKEEVKKSNVLLAIIGPTWLDTADATGNRRLDDPNDFVRVEISTALKRGINVIPIFLDGAQVPKPDQLPVGLKELSSRNGLDVRHSSFQSDMDRLVKSLREQGLQAAQRMAPVDTAVPLREAALRLYEQTRHTPFASFPEQLSGGRPNDILIWAANYLQIKNAVRGCRLPSRVLEDLPNLKWQYDFTHEEVVARREPHEIYNKLQVDFAHLTTIIDRAKAMVHTTDSPSRERQLAPVHRKEIAQSLCEAAIEIRTKLVDFPAGAGAATIAKAVSDAAYEALELLHGTDEQEIDQLAHQLSDAARTYIWAANEGTRDDRQHIGEKLMHAATCIVSRLDVKAT